MKKNFQYRFITPAIVLLLLFSILPMLQVFYYSFMKYNIFQGSRFTGLDNYIKLVSDSKFWYALLNSVLYISVTPVLIVVSLFMALMIRNTSAFSKIFRSIYFLPVVTPIVVVGIIWRWILAEDYGLFNYLLSLLGINKFHWLTSYPENMFSIMIVTIWRGMGYYMMIFLAGLAVIPKEVEEAAILDGAGKIKQITHIIIPLLKPTILLVFVTSATSAIKLFTEIYIMIPGAPMSNKTLVAYLYNQSFERFDFGYGSTLGVVIFILTISFAYMNVRLMEKD